jgi:lysozyme family protein
MAASSYYDALARLLAHEGGYTNHSSDPGGPTNFGITLADYRRHINPDAAAVDVKAMKRSEAVAIYRAQYWDALRCDELPAGDDYAVFDYGVNSGIGRAGKVLRRVLKLSDATAAITDGVLACARRRDAVELVRAICDERLSFLKRLKTWPVFGAGWGRRVAEVRAVALAMATAQAKAEPKPAPAPGKGVVTIDARAQAGTAGGIATAGAAAALKAHRAGLRPVVIAAIVIVTVALAIGGWFAWRWHQRRRQEAAN